jgi:hypothetical protein
MSADDLDIVIRGKSHLIEGVMARKPVLIDGVEVSQAIQYYRAKGHLTDPADQREDNSIRLVADKPAWVRVYVRSTFTDISGITGVLSIFRRSFGSYQLLMDGLWPKLPGTITARVSPVYVDQRNNIRSTLNFVIPASYMIGLMKLNVRVDNRTTPFADNSTFHDDYEVYLDVTLSQTLPLVGIMVGYNGSNDKTPPANITLPAPTLRDLQDTSAWTLTTYPVSSRAVYRIAARTVTCDKPLSGVVPPSDAGGCTQGWYDLGPKVEDARLNDGNRKDVVYVGLVNPSIPMGSNNGCATGGVSCFRTGDQMPMAHEIGHYLGLKHAPCGTSGARVDNRYPIYEPYDVIPPAPPATPNNASIGEYGIDINNGNIYTPRSFKDFMAYCGPFWVSCYHYERLINKSLLHPSLVGTDPWHKTRSKFDPDIIPEEWPPTAPPDPPFPKVISIIGVVRSDKEVEVHTVARLEASSDPPIGAEATEFIAELVDHDKRAIATAPLYSLPSYGHGCCGCKCDKDDAFRRPPFTFEAFLDNVAPGASLRVIHGQDEIWSRHAPTEPTIIKHVNARVQRSASLFIEWNIQSEVEQDLKAWLQWSPNKGKSWLGLAVGLKGKSAKLDISSLPPGPVLIRLLAHDGFATVISEPLTIRVPKLPPVAVILNPQEDTTFRAGDLLRLWGMASYSYGKPIDRVSARWLIDGKEMAKGLDDFVMAPPQGQHRCTFIVEAEGKTVEQTIKFRTIPDQSHEETRTRR